MYRQSEKNLLSGNMSSTCTYNMVNFGPLTAEICWRVWGTPANFNGFRVLAALLYGTLVVGVSQLCGTEQRAPPIFDRAAITLGTGPYSSYSYILSVSVVTKQHPQPFYGAFSGTTRVSWCHKRTSRLYGARED